MKRVGAGLGFASLLVSSVASADPPTPSGAHPRLFMSSGALATYKTNATNKGTAAAGLVAQCDDTIANPNDYSMRGGSDGNYWPQSAVACAFAYEVTGTASYLAQAIKYWQASLSDDQTIGDGKGCTTGASTDWQTWAANMNGAAPPIILTVTHDTDYPFRWFAPDIALTYDWLYSANGTSALVTQTQKCLPAWIDFYTGYGYHHDEAGANYNAGYIIGKALGAIAIGTDGGADGHMWTQILDDDFGKLLIGDGLAGTNVIGTPAGVMLGGDWGEGWQYGPLSVLEYSAASSALESQGATLPLVDQWAGELALRDIYAVTTPGDAIFCGNGDCDITTPNNTPNVNELDAVLVGNSSEQAAAWAASMKQTQSLKAGTYVYNAFAEARAVTPSDYTKQTTAPPLWYLARGTRQMYVRSAWNDPNAFWGVFMSEPQLNSDHQHFAASNFVFSRGADDLVVDPSPYGGYASFETNALSADAANLTGDYAMTQTPWSKAELLWARATADATFAARADIAHAFDFNSPQTLSDITYAHREWVMLPEGEVVLIDRAHTSATGRDMFVTLHTNTGGGGLAASNGIYTGTVGGSKVAIHPVHLSGGTPSVSTPAIFNGNCSLSCNYPCGQCTDTRFKVDAYTVSVPGTWAVAVHVIDGLSSADAAPTVVSIDDPSVDPNAQNAGVIGASILRSGKQSYVVASSATDGVSPATMTYSVPGTGASRHVVYDAPEASDGTSSVSVAANGGRCVVSITAGSGKGFTGHPLMFDVASASDGCTPTDSPGSAPPDVDGGAPTGDGGTPNGDGGTNPGGGSSGCGCAIAGAGNDAVLGFFALAPFVVLFVRRRRRS
jgi:MYXO-CTERM domain-containing protein